MASGENTYQFDLTLDPAVIGHIKLKNNRDLDVRFRGVRRIPGQVWLALRVNGQKVTISSKDLKDDKYVDVQVDDTVYRFQGVKTEGKHLFFTITNLSSKRRKENEYPLGKKFTLDLPIKAGSDKEWLLSPSPGLGVVKEELKENKLRVTLRGVEQGDQFISVRYGYPGHEDEARPKIFRFVIS